MQSGCFFCLTQLSILCWLCTPKLAAVDLLESTQYLRNQLIRDSDWASRANSLERRIPLVDEVLLASLGPYVSDFTKGAGKAMLARSPLKSLPESIINRPKTGFCLPMERWLLEASDTSAWGDLPLLATPGTPWARRWVKTVMKEITE